MLIFAILLLFHTLTSSISGRKIGNDPIQSDWYCFRQTAESNGLIKCRIPLDRWRSIQRQFVQRSLFRSQIVLEPYFFDFTTNPIDVRLATKPDDTDLITDEAVFFQNEPENLRFIYDTLVPKIKHLLGSSATTTTATSSNQSGTIEISGSLTGNVPNILVPQTSLPHYVHVVNNLYGGGMLLASNQTLEPHKITESTSTTTESIVLTKKPTNEPNSNVTNLATEIAIEQFVNSLLENHDPNSNILLSTIGGDGAPTGTFTNTNNPLEQGAIAFPVKIGTTGSSGNDGNYYASSGNGLAVINIELGANGSGNDWQIKKTNGSSINLVPIVVTDNNTTSSTGHLDEHLHNEMNKKKLIISALIQKKIKENQQFIDLIDQIVKIKGN